jgi:hypothetical protein
MDKQVVMRRSGKRGAVVGLVAGLVAIAGVFAVAVDCLPFRISSPAPPWPWYCSDPAYGIIGYVAFPVNLLTNDLSQAILFAPLSLSICAILGALIGLGIARSRSSSSRR